MWFAARSSGMVAILLMTATILLGILGPLRVGSASWPRFALAGLHRNISLLTLALLLVHVVTVAADDYVPITFADAVIPFLSRYQPFWLGLGAISFDVLLALIITSLLRSRINLRLWKGIHWLAYLSWPIALAHGIGAGTDAASPIGLVTAVVSIVSVLVAVPIRIAGRDRPPIDSAPPKPAPATKPVAAARPAPEPVRLPGDFSTRTR
ncbi:MULTISPECIES: ferric reductase-like transmembrane domain-containing protein [Catenuloplanes]|uniref:Ferric reductase n=1 Tax=Catenuloplanes niger TaxID=587534 RepID=A0AAE3ZR83_9ACTN|nr:ferric reductase-like transmembrane domain-containing protein [Catenuloplanes niger]MDR7324589.1 putative ferric reductase [Catenuloplanes niger]